MDKSAGLFAIIPSNIRYDTHLSSNVKILYAEITSLVNKHGYCWASNDYFANIFAVSERSVQRWIEKLIESKYLEREYEYSEDGRSILRRILRLNINFGAEVQNIENNPKNADVDKSNEPNSSEKYAKCADNIDLSTKNGKDIHKIGGGDTDDTRGWCQNCHQGGDKNVMDNNNIANTSKLINTYISNNRAQNKRACEVGKGYVDNLVLGFDIDDDELMRLREAFLDMFLFKEPLGKIYLTGEKAVELYEIIDTLIKATRLTKSVTFKNIVVSSTYFKDMLMNLTLNNLIMLGNAYRTRKKKVKNKTYYIMGLLVNKADNDWDYL